VQALDSAGLKKDTDYAYAEVADGVMNESGWQSRVEPMLTFLFKANSPATPASQPTAAVGP